MALATPSSPRMGSPHTSNVTARIISTLLDSQVQEVGRTADARVIAADELLELMRHLGVRQREDAGSEHGQVVLDRCLVLARRRHDLRIAHEAVVADLVSMEEEPTRCLRRPCRDSWPGDPWFQRRGRWPIGLENLGCLGERVEQLDRPRNDAAEDVGMQLVAKPGLAQRIGRDRVQRGPSQRDASRRAQEVRGPVVAERLQRVRPRDLVLGEGIGPCARVPGRARRSRRCDRRSSGIRKRGAG